MTKNQTTQKLLQKRLKKASRHFTALKEYKFLIEQILIDKNIYQVDEYKQLQPADRAIFDAYLKRFSSLQDFLGAKIFPLLLDIAGINNNSLSEVLLYVEKEQIIDSLDSWIELRAIRNELEHDYPEIIREALENLKYCVDSFDRITSYYKNSVNFSNKYIK
ncbi:MAG: hypothetical protein DRQ51_01675 [Gammaproteobacteria bacterium]|nr:MAG: hypothetical protein DRQ51_01675 [Gammaproteobacteria bacterium]